MAEAQDIKIDPAMAQIFAQKFPGVELTHFIPAKDVSGAVHRIVFIGHVDDLVDFGLVDASMIAPKPKRVATPPGPLRKGDEYWHTQRLSANRLRVCREITKDVRPDHSLAIFAPGRCAPADMSIDFVARIRAVGHFQRLASWAVIENVIWVNWADQRERVKEVRP